MIENSRTREVRRAQRESLIKKELLTLFLDIKLSDKNLDGVFISDVKLSEDKGTVYVLFYMNEGESAFNEKMRYLILYKPSARKAIAQLLNARYTPQVVFKYDKTFEKQQKIEKLLDQIKDTEETTEETPEEITKEIKGNK